MIHLAPFDGLLHAMIDILRNAFSFMYTFTTPEDIACFWTRQSNQFSIQAALLTLTWVNQASYHHYDLQGTPAIHPTVSILRDPLDGNMQPYSCFIFTFHTSFFLIIIFFVFLIFISFFILGIISSLFFYTWNTWLYVPVFIIMVIMIPLPLQNSNMH